MNGQDLPLWLDISVSLLVLAGAAIAFLGSLGLLRLKSYFERVHAPAIIATMACWCVMHATLLYFSMVGEGLAVHALLIALFVAVTVPVTNIFLMRAALFRARRMGEAVPANLSRTATEDAREPCASLSLVALDKHVDKPEQPLYCDCKYLICNDFACDDEFLGSLARSCSTGHWTILGITLDKRCMAVLSA